MPVLQAIFQNFRGLNRTSDRLNSSPEFLYDLLNGYIKKDARTNLGVITQRAGAVKVNSTALDTGGYGTTTKIRTIFETKWDGGSTDLIIRAGTAWGKFATTSFDTIDGGRADDAIGQCAMFKNELIMVDGAVPRKMTAAFALADLSTDGNMPKKADVVWVHRDKVWLNDTDHPMIAHFSLTNTASVGSAWTGSTDAGTIDLSTVLPVGDRIRAFRTYGGADTGLIAIICDKYTVIYQAGANTYDFVFIQYFPTTCLSPNAVDYMGKDLVYPSRNSLTSLFSSQQNNALEVKPLSTFIENLYRDLVALVTTTQQISGVFCQKLNHYYINFPITNNHQMLVYSADIGNFVGRWKFPFNIYSMLNRNNGDFIVGSDNYVYEINDDTVYSDDGTKIDYKISMPAFYFKDPSRYKKPIDFEALFYTENVDPAIVLDYSYGGVGTLSTDKSSKAITLSAGGKLYYWDIALWDVSYWADVAASYLYRTGDLVGRGRAMTIDLSQSTLNARLTMAFFKIGYVLEGVN